MTAAVIIRPGVNPGPHRSILVTPSCSKTSRLGERNPGPTKRRLHARVIKTVHSRRERPCDACRKRKSRCVIHDGALLCVLCDFHKQDCTFVEAPQPRKRKSETDEHKSVKIKKKRHSHSHVEIRHSQNINTTRPISDASISKCPDFSSELRASLGFQNDKHSRYIGPTTPLDPTLLNLIQFDPYHESTLGSTSLRKVSDHEHFITLSDESTPNFEDDAEDIGLIEHTIHPHGPTLIDFYFRCVHPSFPIIHRQIFLEQYRSGRRQISPALLAGIYILALNWSSSDSALANVPKPDSGRLEDIAWRCLAKALNRPGLSAVQAGLLLLQRPKVDSWSLTTRLVAIGQQLGLHLDCSDWTIPLWERVLRKDLAWALYLHDKWSSLIHGHPSCIHTANWAAKPLSEHESQDIIQPSAASDTEEMRAEQHKGRTLFRQMIALTGIMSEVLDTFYTQSAIQEFNHAGKSATRPILERAKPVQIKLKDWFANLPASTRMDDLNGGGPSSNGALHLAYFATEITLHRRILSSLPTTLSSDPSPYLTHICRSAAKTRLISAMDFANRLRPQHLSAFWYFPSTANFALIGTFGALLMATAPGREEAEFYRARLQEYRWTLGASVKRAGWLGSAVATVDLCAEMLRGLGEKPRIFDVVAKHLGEERMGKGSGEKGWERLDEEGRLVPEMKRYPSGMGFEGLEGEMLDGYSSDEESESSGS